MPYTIKPLVWEEVSKNRFTANGITGTYRVVCGPDGKYTWGLTLARHETGFINAEAAKKAASIHHATAMLPYLQTC